MGTYVDSWLVISTPLTKIAMRIPRSRPLEKTVDQSGVGTNEAAHPEVPHSGHSTWKYKVTDSHY